MEQVITALHWPQHWRTASSSYTRVVQQQGGHTEHIITLWISSSECRNCSNSVNIWRLLVYMTLYWQGLVDKGVTFLAHSVQAVWLRCSYDMQTFNVWSKTDRRSIHAVYCTGLKQKINEKEIFKNQRSVRNRKGPESSWMLGGGYEQFGENICGWVLRVKGRWPVKAMIMMPALWLWWSS